MTELLDLVDHPHGHKVLLSVLALEKPRYFTQDERRWMAEALVTEGEGKEAKEVPVSKKPAELRRQQLLDTLLEPLLTTCTENAEALCQSTRGSYVLLETLQEAHRRVHAASTGERKDTGDQRTRLEEAFAALAALGLGEALRENSVCHLVLKRLLVELKPDASMLAQPLVELCSNTDHVEKLATLNRPAFIMVAIIEVSRFRSTCYNLDLVCGRTVVRRLPRH